MAAHSESGAAPPDTTDLGELRRAAEGCHGCGLYRDATATAFGTGNGRAEILAVGEQPGDQEDCEGAPFVGPAGQLLDQALEEAGIDRGSLYVTNAVKHFKFKLRGKRRTHDKPARSEIIACRPRLVAEVRTLRPRLVLLLGATAARSLSGTAFRLTRHRGETLDPPEEFCRAVHHRGGDGAPFGGASRPGPGQGVRRVRR